MDVQTATDTRPALPVSEDSLWDKAAIERDRIAVLIDAEFKKENLIAWVRRSKPGEYPLYVAVDSWIQASETPLSVTFDRSSLEITISVDPYRERPLIYAANLQRHGRAFSDTYWELSQQEVSELARYLMKGGDTPSFFEPRVSGIERFLGAFIPFVGNPPKNKLVREARPRWTGTTVLAWTGILVAILSGILAAEADEYSNDSSLYLMGVVIGLGCLVASAIIAKRRPKLDAIPKQSLRTPRREYRVDSWHVSVTGAGEQFDHFRERLYNAVLANDQSIEVNRELHQNLTPRGFEERERLVLTKGQATLHIHVYPFSRDAFVGWESYLNWNRWAEGEPVSKTVRDGKNVTYHSLKVGVHVPTDFDLIEADLLTETTHRVLVDEIKAFLREREIEADLDFRIIRGDRTRALQEGKDEKAK